ncbi:MAG: alpha-L-fucosidase, partial [Phycisphaerales bacterium]
MDATPYGKDLLKPLAEACRKHGIVLGFYYSQAQDWNHPGGAAAGGHWDPAQDGDMDEYIRTIAVPQVREILSNYGKLGVLWWDTPTNMNKERADMLLPLLELQPGIITNNRLGGGYGGDLTTPEQHIPATGIPGRDWETCMTMNDTWGYKSYDHNWKSPTDLVQKLVDIASKGGNFLLNVGPTAEGIIPEPSVQHLSEMGKWLRINGEAIYGTRLWNPQAKYDPEAEAAAFGPGPEERPETEADPQTNRKKAGIRYTLKGNTLYAIFFAWPANGTVAFKELAAGRTAQEIAKVELLGSTDRVEWSRNQVGLSVRLPATPPCDHAFVL